MPLVPQIQEYQGILKDAMTTPLTADGQSNPIDFYVNGGCQNSDLVIRLLDMEGTGTLLVKLQEWINNAWANTVYQMSFAAGANGDYVMAINNDMIKGSKLRLDFDITAGDDADGIKLKAWLRPRVM